MSLAAVPEAPFEAPDTVNLAGISCDTFNPEMAVAAFCAEVAIASAWVLASVGVSWPLANLSRFVLRLGLKTMRSGWMGWRSVGNVTLSFAENASMAATSLAM